MSMRERFSSESTMLLWHGLPEPGRGRRRTLTLPQIVTAAIAVADELGVEALSMRAIAERLDVGTMSLYRYVPTKAALLDLALDHLVAPAEVWHGELPGTGPRWRRALGLSAREGRNLYLTHPWLLQVNWSRPTFGPNTLASVEAVLHGLRDLAVPDRTRITIISAVDAFVTGAVRAQLLFQQAPQETGLSDEDYWAAQGPVLEYAMSTGNYPNLAAMGEGAFDGGWDEMFDLGLTALLDGIAARYDV